jgi:ABC-type branched-subunit amino acid transport system ATPase component
VTLAVEAVSVRFGTTAALAGVDLHASAGECVGVVGPNGAGKTTLLDVVSGLVAPGRGRVRLGAGVVTGLPPDRVARAGVARTFQAPRLFGRMTVAANVRAGRPLDPRPWLALVGLLDRQDDLAGALVPGDARRVELARALASDPRVLLLDEPCGGLTPAETEAMAGLIQGAATPRRILVLVEHKLDVVARLCQRVVVLDRGEKIFDGPAGAFRGEARVQEAYWGPDPGAGTGR